MTEPLLLNGVPIEATFAEAFGMKATRIIITAHDRGWVTDAAAAVVGFGTSVIGCRVEIDVEQELDPSETPDGRPGVAILAFAMSSDDLDKQIVKRTGQCVLTCPSTALFAGFDADREANPKRVSLGKSLRFFGDGHQISKVINGQRYWRVPVMDGEFICQHDVARVNGIGGGNFLLLGTDFEAASRAARAAAAAIKPMPGVITPFPGGATRSGSKVGSKYEALFASTNEAFCPTLRGVANSEVTHDAAAVLEIVLDGLSEQAIADAMKVGIEAACREGGGHGLLAVTAGNYGGKLGKYHFHLAEILS